MTTWYIDPVAGTDANASAGNGDSFATRRKSISNIVAAASAPGDTVRIMGSPDATSLGINGTWTEGPPSASPGISGATNATPIVITQAGHPYVDGDTCLITNVGTNTNANGVWEVGSVTGTTYALLNADGSNSVGNGVGSGGNSQKISSCRVMLASAINKTVALTGNRGTKTNWTASANVTNTIITTDNKEGAECQQIAIAAGFTTGMAAHFPLGASTDFSGYQQISFWIKQTAGTIGAAGATTLTLCSDTAGATPVDTFDVPALGALNRWVPVTVNKGSALGATIQSVAFNVVTDNAAQTFLIDNIQACKALSSADSLNLQSLIGKAATGGEFYAIQSINGKRVMLDQDVNKRPAYADPARGYYVTGGTETVTTYKRETFKTTPVASAGTAVQTVNESGTDGNLITYSGGWNTTDMSTQTMETWFDGLNGLGYGINIPTKNFLNSEKIGMVRYYTGVLSVTTRSSLSFLGLNNNTFYGLDGTNTISSSVTIGSVNNNLALGVTLASSNEFTITNLNGNGSYGLYLSSVNNNRGVITNVNGNVTYGVFMLTAYNNALKIANIKANTGYGVFNQTGDNNTICDAAMSGNASGSVLYSGSYHKLYLNRCTLSDSAEVTGTAENAVGYGGVYSRNNDATADTHIFTLNNGTIRSEASVRHTASGIAWKLSPTSTNQTWQYNPFTLSIAEVACASGSQVTANLWMRRTHTGLTARFMCRGGQIDGVASDVSTSMTAAADTWEQVTITFTPTEIGVVELVAECWGGTTYSLYVDDFSVSQA